MINIRDREFRDMSRESKYPFRRDAILGTISGVIIPEEVFLAIKIQARDPKITLPIYLSKISVKNEKEVIIVFTDSTDTIVGTAGLLEGLDTVSIYKDTVPIGYVIYGLFSYLLDIFRNVSQGLFGTNLPLEIGVCTTKVNKQLRSIQGIQSKQINIIARNGVHFTEEEGEVAIHLLGEDSDTITPISFINDSPVDQYRLSATTESSIKVVTKEGKITIGSVNDYS